MDSGGRLSFDGAPIAEASLGTRLKGMREAAPEAQLHLAVDAEARYEDFDRVLAAVKRAGVEHVGFIGHHAFKDAI
jgi:biopolymer transport protein ExbD